MNELTEKHHDFLRKVDDEISDIIDTKPSHVTRILILHNPKYVTELLDLHDLIKLLIHNKRLTITDEKRIVGFLNHLRTAVLINRERYKIKVDKYNMDVNDAELLDVSIGNIFSYIPPKLESSTVKNKTSSSLFFHLTDKGFLLQK